MKTSDTGLALIKHFEGYYGREYKCPAGKPTIGYGHVILPNEEFDQLSEAEASDLLARDVIPCEASVSKLVFAPLEQNQFDALVSFVYNLGAGALRNSTLLRYLNGNDYRGAADQFLRWDHVGQNVLAGLTKRRQAERRLFLTGEFDAA